MKAFSGSLSTREGYLKILGGLFSEQLVGQAVHFGKVGLAHIGFGDAAVVVHHKPRGGGAGLGGRRGAAGGQLEGVRGAGPGLLRWGPARRGGAGWCRGGSRRRQSLVGRCGRRARRGVGGCGRRGGARRSGGLRGTCRIGVRGGVLDVVLGRPRRAGLTHTLTLIARPRKWPGTFADGRGHTACPGTGFLSPTASKVPVRGGTHLAARNVPASERYMCPLTPAPLNTEPGTFRGPQQNFCSATRTMPGSVVVTSARRWGGCRVGRVRGTWRRRRQARRPPRSSGRRRSRRG